MPTCHVLEFARSAINSSKDICQDSDRFLETLETPLNTPMVYYSWTEPDKAKHPLKNSARSMLHSHFLSKESVIFPTNVIFDHHSCRMRSSWLPPCNCKQADPVLSAL